MTTKEQILRLLTENSAAFLSGEQIAQRLFVTRAAVWKAVKSLQKEGYTIEGVTNKGYRLLPDTTRPDAGRIKKEAMLPPEMPVLFYENVPSTNDTAKEFEKKHPGRDAIILAESQSSGRGRRGRRFYSPAKTGMYFSLLLHPQICFQDAVRLTCLTAEALCRAVEEVTGCLVSIKWVNDLYYQEKKIAGILTESEASVEDGSLSYVVIGAGLNLYAPLDGFPAEIKAAAGSLFSGAPQEDLVNKLYAAIFRHFFALYADSSLTSFIDGYRAHSMLIGRYVKINSFTTAQNKRAGYALVKGIDDACRLLVCYDNGKEDALTSGEVSVVRY